MSNTLCHFQLLNQDSQARQGRITCTHGDINTPAFMPVATYGAVKSLSNQDLTHINNDILLANAFHLSLPPVFESIKAHQGLNIFMNWHKPILTDSGGFQVFSLSHKITEEGAYFRSPRDGREVFMGPEQSMQVQHALAPDIAMIFDDCPPHPISKEKTEKSMQLSLKWAKRSFDTHQQLQSQSALFGIVQGGIYEDLRKASLASLSQYPFSGFAIGGLSVGEDKSDMQRVLEFTTPLLPKHKPRYLMGVGSPTDLLFAISTGVDMFDCVMPSRNARNAHLFTSKGIIRLRNKQHTHSTLPIDEVCNCYTCQNHTRGYLQHLLKINEMLGSKLATIHNLYFYNNLMQKARLAIQNQTFADFHRYWRGVFS